MQLLARISAAAVLVLACVEGHGALVYPLSRNAVERSLPWLQRTPNTPCYCANLTAGTASASERSGCDNAQACYWYSQGCTIGCPTCDGTNGRVQIDLCGLGEKATINDPQLRTVNRRAEAGSVYDIYKHNPWRAPGSAPVADACGLAGGARCGHNISEWGDYVNTTFAHHGDVGTKVLHELPTSAVWTLGGEAEVVWQSSANHGGGYQYRLCPAWEPLTEACFQRHALEFVRDKQALAFSNGTRLPIKGTFVDVGTLPEGSSWAMNPIPPRELGSDASPDYQCKPCPGTLGSDCTSCDNNHMPKFPPPCDETGKPGLCSGQGYSRWGAVATVDVVKVPAKLPLGKYVLGWRLDCEATAQVWSNCADITVVAPKARYVV